jgi:hypothetical protein
MNIYEPIIAAPTNATNLPCGVTHSPLGAVLFLTYPYLREKNETARENNQINRENKQG